MWFICHKIDKSEVDHQALQNVRTNGGEIVCTYFNNKHIKLKTQLKNPCVGVCDDLILLTDDRKPYVVYIYETQDYRISSCSALRISLPKKIKYFGTELVMKILNFLKKILMSQFNLWNGKE